MAEARIIIVGVIGVILVLLDNVGLPRKRKEKKREQVSTVDKIYEILKYLDPDLMDSIEDNPTQGNANELIRSG